MSRDDVWIATMPVLHATDKDSARFKALGCPRSVDWFVVASHERQARRNHDQSLTVLRTRGGLSPSELCAILEDRKWHAMSDEDAVKRLLELVGERP